MYDVFKYILYDPAQIAYKETYQKKHDIRMYYSIVLAFLSNLPMNFYALMTVKNIDFKLYMCYIFLDNAMIDQIKGTSIFLVGEPKITFKEIPHQENSEESLNFDISFLTRMVESDHGGYNTDEENEGNHRLIYRNNQTFSRSFSN